MPNATVTVGARNAPRTSDPSGAPSHVGGRHLALGLVLGLGLVGVVSLVGGARSAVVVAAVALVPASVAATIDVVTSRLPSVWLAATAAVAALAASADGASSQWALAAVGAAIACLPLLAAHLVDPASLGFGDVRFAAALGATVGAAAADSLAAVLAALVTVASASGIAIVAAASLRRRHVAFGPCLVLGAAVALCCTGALGGTPLP